MPMAYVPLQSRPFDHGLSLVDGRRLAAPHDLQAGAVRPHDMPYSGLLLVAITRTDDQVMEI